jgi:zinc/manganese transport system substrate-binding protein
MVLSTVSTVMRLVLSIGVATTAVLAAGCDAERSGNDGPTIVVTSTILGDIVSEVVGDAAEVEVLLPIGADPHEFAPSARQVEAMADASLVVVNGEGFEHGLEDAIDQAADAGAPVFTATEHTTLLDEDPHIWTDPSRMVPVVEALADALVEDAELEESGVRDRAAAYADALQQVDGEIDTLLAPIPAERRVLVTNHEVLGYFADRYGFEVVGAVIPSLTTGAEPSAADVEELADVIESEDVTAIFGETSSPTRLADALAEAAGGDVEVVTLFTESLGEPGSGAETYLDLLRTDAELIEGALA